MSFTKDTPVLTDFGVVTVPKGFEWYDIKYHPYNDEKEIQYDKTNSYRFLPGLEHRGFRKEITNEKLKEFYFDLPK
jgi:hypothetical protein